MNNRLNRFERISKTILRIGEKKQDRCLPIVEDDEEFDKYYVAAQPAVTPRADSGRRGTSRRSVTPDRLDDDFPVISTILSGL